MRVAVAWPPVRRQPSLRRGSGLVDECDRSLGASSCWKSACSMLSCSAVSERTKEAALCMQVRECMQCACSLRAVCVQCACSLCAACVQCARTAHVVHVRCTCGAHGVHMRCTWRAHAMHMRCTLRCTCGAHAVHMRCTCGAHAVHMRCTCDALAGGVPACASGSRRPQRRASTGGGSARCTAGWRGAARGTPAAARGEAVHVRCTCGAHAEKACR